MMKQSKQNIIVWIIIFLMVLPVIRIATETEIFIPTSIVDHIAITICATICSIPTFYLLSRTYNLTAEEKLKYELRMTGKGFDPHSKILKILVPIMTIVLFTHVLYAGVFLYIGTYYTRYNGTDYKDAALITYKKSVAAKKECGYGYKISSPQFTGALGLRFLCANHEVYQKIPYEGAILKVNGKISNWGRTITSYEVPEQTTDLKLLYKKQDQLIAEWK